MPSVKTFILSLTVALLLSPAAHTATPFIGQQANPEAQIEQRLAAMKKRLNMTDAQTEAAEPILRDAIARQQAILTSYGLGPDSQNDGERPSFRQLRQMQGDMQDLRKDVDKRLKKVLSKDQMKILNQLRKERQEQMRDRIRGRSK